MASLSTQRDEPLLSLGDMAPRAGLVERAAITAVEAWLRDPDGPVALWLHGPPGSGRTTAAAAAVRQARSTGRHARRVACGPGLSIEEVLDDAAALLVQVGSPELANVLEQRSRLRSKVVVLSQALARLPFLLWLDESGSLLEADAVSNHGAGAGPGPPQEALGLLLEAAGRLRSCGGRLLITAAEPPPADLARTGGEGVRVESLGGLEASEELELWRRLGTPAELVSRAVAARQGRRPLTVEVLARSLPSLPPGAIGEILLLDDDEALEKVFEWLIPGLSAGAAALLDAAAALPPGATRQSLRAVAGAVGVELELKDLARDAVLRELDGLGLLQAPRGEEAGTADGTPAELPSPLRRFLESRLRRESPERWKSLQAAAGAYFSFLAEKSRNRWHLVRAWRGFFLAGLYAEAYEVQKIFVPELIEKGCLGISRRILEGTVKTVTGVQRAVALGNLALLHKNEGDLTRALETYAEIARDFASRGDRPNTARALHQLGNTHYLNRNYAAALRHYEQSLAISTDLADSSVAAVTRIQIANALYQSGRRDEALACYRDALEDERVTRNPALASAVDLQVGLIHFQGKRYVEADSSFREAKARATGDLRTLLKVCEAQAAVARERREYDLARARLNEALAAATALGDLLEAAMVLILSGDVERMRMQLAEALKCYEASRRLVASAASQEVASAAEAAGLEAKVDERVRSLAEAVGPEAMARLVRAAGR